ncbi:hypothetical protein [Streptomyces sp. NPDC048527]|uniref:hypothetical protein n=1 Tax=Streptomyces sp. NPDC048527 TaxID=3365568 RepID=UPI003724554C
MSEHQRGVPRTECERNFEQILEQALNATAVASALDRPDCAIDRERLRAIALRERAAIEGVVAVEYAEYLRATARAGARESAPAQDLAASAPAPFSRTRDGLLPALAVLVPRLAGVAAAVFLLLGYGLGVFGARPYLGDGLVVAGVIAAAVAVGAVLGDVAWILAAAIRNRSGAAQTAPGVAGDAALRRAGEERRRGLLESGILAFLLHRLGGAPGAGPGKNAGHE